MTTVGTAQSKQEIVTRLGIIDQFIRVCRMEREPSRRVITLQSAHAEVTSLNGKFVGDRLIRDLRRLFSLSEAV